ncbi:MAG TPA: hypothetical protein VGK87_11505 [Anaerolineae bacterium]|jgi:hypothetical protein
MNRQRPAILTVIMPATLMAGAAIAIAYAITTHAPQRGAAPAALADQTSALTHTVALPLVMRLPSAVACSNIAQNGDFEAPLPGHPWTGVANTSIVYVDTFISRDHAHSGAQSGRVGSLSRNSVWNEMLQTVQMPAGVVSATLTYWRYLDTTETSLTTVYDLFTAGIETEQGIQIAVPQQIDNTSAGRATWVQGRIDLPNAVNWSGRRLWLSFKAATDSNLPSSLYIDDVSFVVCATP